MELETPLFMEKSILNFHFDYLIISLRKSCSSSRPVGIERTDKGCPSQLFRYLFCVFLHNFGSFREASVPQIAFRSPSSEVVIGVPQFRVLTNRKSQVWTNREDEAGI